MISPDRNNRLLECPLCGRKFEARDSNALPFCTPRCRQIDLGRWLGEQYSVPHVPQDIDEDPEEELPGEDL